MDKKKILVVDDDQDLHKMLELRIEKEGYEHMSAYDGEEMLELIKNKKPDLIILDVMLPKMNGYDALREMRKDDKFKDIPVIILTAKEKENLEDIFKFEDIAAFIEKPFDADKLLQKIKGVLYG